MIDTLLIILMGISFVLLMICVFIYVVMNPIPVLAFVVILSVFHVLYG